MHDFWAMCPHTPAELIKKDRRREVKTWRQIGMVWATLTGESISEAARHFGRDHATVLHAQQIVIDTLEGFGDEFVRIYIDRIKEHTFCSAEVQEDINTNEAICMVILDAQVGIRVWGEELARKQYEYFINKSNNQ